MKRTLAAAATVVASSAGALGFAGTATAAEVPDAPQSPVDLARSGGNLPIDQADLSHAVKEVGGVIPAELSTSGGAGAQPRILPTTGNLGKPVNASIGFDQITGAAEGLLGKAPIVSDLTKQLGAPQPAPAPAPAPKSGAIENVTSTPRLGGEEMLSGVLSAATNAAGNLTG